MLRSIDAYSPHIAHLTKPDLARYIFAQLDRIKDKPEAVQRALASVLPFVPFEMVQMRLSDMSVHVGEFDVREMEKLCKGMES